MISALKSRLQTAVPQERLYWLATVWRKLAATPLPVIWLALCVATLWWTSLGRADFPFDPDEAYSVLQARAHSWAELVSLNLGNEQTPPLYFVALRLWALLWNDSTEGTLRLFSACCMAATVPALGLLGRWIGGRSAGFWIALLMAVNPLARIYAQDTRSYGLGVLLSALILLAAYSFLARPGWRGWLCFVVSATALCYTTYYAAFTVSGLSLVGLGVIYSKTRASRQRRAFVGGWLSAFVAILLAYAPWLPGLFYQYHMIVFLGVAPHTSSGLAFLLKQFAQRYLLSFIVLGAGLPNGQLMFNVAKLLFAVIALAVVVLLWRRRAGNLALAWVCGIALPLLGSILIFQGLATFEFRYTIFLLPLYLLCLTLSLGAARKNQAVTRILLIALVGFCLVYAARLQPVGESKGAWTRMARALEQEARADDGLFFAPPWEAPAFLVQYKGPGVALGTLSFADYARATVMPWDIDTVALNNFMRPGRRAWVIWQPFKSTDTPPLPPGLQYQRQTFGSTSLLLVTMPAR